MPLKLRLPSVFRQKTAPSLATPFSGAWHRVFGRDHFPGAWQRHERQLGSEGMIAQSAVFAILKLISGDVSKCCPLLKELQPSGIWQDVRNSAYSPVLTKPNAYQTPMQLLETWALSKLVFGNFYGLKIRDGRNVVQSIYPLNPLRVRPLVTNDGSGAMFYELQADNLTPGMMETVTVPARELFHDRWNCVWHPLIGLSPLLAAAGPATQAHETERLMSQFYRNSAQPSGLLIAPGQIDPDTVKRLENQWSKDFSGEDTGKIAVLGSGMKWETMSANLVASEIVDQLKYSGTMIAAVFSVPLYKIGLMDQPRAINNIEALQQEYFAQALQVLMEGIEDTLTSGLNLPSDMCVCLDTDNLLRLDSANKVTYFAGLVEKGIMSPNEARKAFNLPPVTGGEFPFLQQQCFPISALANASRPLPGTVAPAQAPAPGGKDGQ